jgi:hypothetical protein
VAKAAKEANKFIGESKTLSSGVTVVVIPFPPGLLQRINSDHPDPIPPKKTIKVLDGTEEVDNLKDKGYLDALDEVTRVRNSLLGEAVIELCVEVDLGKYTKEITKLEKYTSPYPDDLDEQRMRFLQEFALRTRGDYETVITSAITQIAISDEEVQERIATFQSDLSRSPTNGAKAPGANEAVTLEVEST